MDELVEKIHALRERSDEVMGTFLWTDLEMAQATFGLGVVFLSVGYNLWFDRHVNLQRFGPCVEVERLFLRYMPLRL
jgi:hypothetical protein